MIIDCISDPHGNYPELEGGDLLIVAGDLTARDTLTEHSFMAEWLHKQDYKKKVLVAGNHDNLLQKYKDFYSKTSIDYLCDSGTKFCYYPPLEKDAADGTVIERRDFKIWGSPWTKAFPGMNPDCKAFTCDQENDLKAKWAMIPDDTDILITHSPPYGICDEVKGDYRWESVGSRSLQHRVLDIKPKLHVFGHIHEAWGEFHSQGIIFINASHVNERYQPVNKPIRVVL